MQILGTCGQQEAVGSRKLWAGQTSENQSGGGANPGGAGGWPLWEGQGGHEDWGLGPRSL